jgi:hypothetical protein
MPVLQSHRNSLRLGREAARANLAPAFLIQTLMLGLLAGYYLSSSVANLLNDLATYKLRHGLTNTFAARHTRVTQMGGIVSPAAAWAVS